MIFRLVWEDRFNEIVYLNNFTHIIIFVSIHKMTKVLNIWQYFLNYCRYNIYYRKNWCYVSIHNITYNEWIHIVLNYIGPNDEQGFGIYHNAIQVENVMKRCFRLFSPRANRNIVVGRIYSEIDDAYSSVQVDELYFFNRVLTEAEIRMLSQDTVWIRPVPPQMR